jgi:hypothetical protein
MPFYEIVYETGNRSVAYYEGNDEAQAALSAHHEKAKTGESATPASEERTDIGVPPAGPTEWPAERIAKVYVFETHPAEFGADQIVAAGTLGENLNAMRDEEGNVNAAQAAAMVRASTSPFINPEHPHDSEYAAPHEELAWENA